MGVYRIKHYALNQKESLYESAQKIVIEHLFKI